jgi:hypothetical protein
MRHNETTFEKENTSMQRIALATLLFFTTAIIAPGALMAQGQGQGQGNAQSIAIPVVGSGAAGTFVGTFQLQRFVANGSGVDAVGLVTGTLTSSTGVVTSVVQTVATQAAVVSPTCDILHLDLGPLHLNILGLNIDLSRIVLDITAQSGAGNLLGNLLCGVANLLNNPSGLANILNRILAILG